MSASCPTCHHLHPTGQHCGSPALRGEQFCFYHHPARRPPTRTPPFRTPFDVSPIVDPETLQITLSEIIHRLADNTLDPKRASLLLVTLQMANANLPALPDYPSQAPIPDSASSTARSAASTTAQHGPDFSDPSELLTVPGLHPVPSAPAQ